VGGIRASPIAGQLMAPPPPEDLQCAVNVKCAAPPALAAGDGELRWLRRCVEAAAKGFAIGAGLKGGLALFSVLVRIRSRRSPRSRSLTRGRTSWMFWCGFFFGGLTALKLVLVPWRAGECRKAGAMTNEEAVVLAVKETVRYGLFLGTFAGSYVSVDEYIAAVWGRKRSVHGTITV
jgi:hypothetical protein